MYSILGSINNRVTRGGVNFLDKLWRTSMFIISPFVAKLYVGANIQ